MSHEFKKQARKGGSRCLYIILRSHIITLNTLLRALRFSPIKPVCAKSSCSGQQEGPGKGVNPGPLIWGGSSTLVFSLTLTGYSFSIYPASRKTPISRYGKLRNASCRIPVLKDTLREGGASISVVQVRREGETLSATRKFPFLPEEKAVFPTKSYIHYTLTFWVAM